MIDARKFKYLMATTSNRKRLPYLFPLLLFSFTSFSLLLVASAYSVGDLRERDIAGIWRLKSKHTSFLIPKIQSTSSDGGSNTNDGMMYPLKEFTVYPKKKKLKEQSSISKLEEKEEEVLLLLREDGKFAQCSTDSTLAGSSPSSFNASPSSSSSNFSKQSLYNPRRPLSRSSQKHHDEEIEGMMKGTWALVDGKLILAADRPKEEETLGTKAGSGYGNSGSQEKRHDTILVGRVVASSGEGLLENPALQKKEGKGGSDDAETGSITSSSSPVINVVDPNASSSSTNQTPPVQDKELNNNNPTEKAHKQDNTDIHLSVPRGKVKIGKFFYPKNHPSFFEQPIFKPTPTGSFELQQVLGSLNTRRNDEEGMVEKFKKQDLMEKRYFLTSYPTSSRKKKRKQRWSIKYNKFVDDKPKTQKEKDQEEREKNAPIPIKTFEVQLFANNTFTTITGLGDMILRGKWWIIGNDRDQLWMQVWRFGFGRSVSGSTFSEGSTLTQKDEVTYWGKIYEVDAKEGEDDINDNPLDWKGTRIEINGSVMLGWGLEPDTVGRFTMIEKTEEDVDLDDDDDDDEEEGDYDDDLPSLRDDIGSFE